MNIENMDYALAELDLISKKLNAQFLRQGYLSSFDVERAIGVHFGTMEPHIEFLDDFKSEEIMR